MEKLKLLKKLTFKKSGNLFFQSFRYALSGGVAFIVDFLSLYFFTTFFQLHYLISAAISYLIGSAIHYILSILIVFPSSTLENRLAEFTIFALIGVIGLGMNEALMWIFTDRIGLYYLYSKLIATVFIFFWNFSTRKFILFR